MINLGTIQSDGSILLHDENIQYREAMTGRYRRIRQTGRQSVWLDQQGFTTVSSSFISAVGVKESDLYIRFHNSSVYVYYGFANHFDKIMEANSKGQYFNRAIRPTRRYQKTDSMPFPPNLGEAPMTMTDEEMFKAIDVDYIKKVAQNLTGANIQMRTFVEKGLTFTEYHIKHNDKLLKILVPLIGKNIQ